MHRLAVALLCLVALLTGCGSSVQLFRAQYPPDATGTPVALFEASADFQTRTASVVASVVDPRPGSEQPVADVRFVCSFWPFDEVWDLSTWSHSGKTSFVEWAYELPGESEQLVAFAVHFGDWVRCSAPIDFYLAEVLALLFAPTPSHDG